MSRAVFLSAAGDPFTALFALKLFQERWYDEVSKFYIGLNNHCGVPQEVVEEFLATVSREPKVVLIYHPCGIGNGKPIGHMTQIAVEDHVMLLEDDGFIFTPGIVDEHFKMIESGEVDVVGSERFSCGVEVGEASKKKYGLDYSAYGDVGPNYWPNFFFCKRADLLKTDLDFASHTWKAGEYCPHLDHTFKADNHGDTFVWAGVQLRALGLKFKNVPQHHADPYEIENKFKGEGNWIGERPRWIHGGSLSAGWGGYLSGQIPDVSHEVAKKEMETRVAFWKICVRNVMGFEKFREEYLKGIENLISGAKLDIRNIDKKMIIYKELMGL